jgi:hypothetical protein
MQAGGAYEAQPHENSTKRNGFIPKLNTDALYPSRSELQSIMCKKKNQNLEKPGLCSGPSIRSAIDMNPTCQSNFI